MLLAAVILVALSLRAPLLAIAPVTGQVRSGLHIGSATAGLFTSIRSCCSRWPRRPRWCCWSAPDWIG